MSEINTTFIDYVKKNINSLKEIYGIKDNGHAFASWAVGYINELSDDESINYTDTLGKGDGGIDGWYFDEEENIFHLYQVKYSESPLETTFNSSPISELLNGLDIVKDYSTASAKNKKLGKISKNLIDAKNNEASIVLNCILFGTISSSAKLEMKNRCASNSEKPQYEFWDIDKLYDLYISREIGEDLSGVNINVDLVDKNYIKVQSPENNSGIGESIVINLGGKQLASAVENYIPKIFGSNVRYNLGRRNKVNAKIQETLISDMDSSEFWHRNNGITILVNDYSIDEDKLILTNPQIVNGCQTVSTMVESLDRIKDRVLILSKIVKVDSNQIGKHKALEISESTNSQSPVKSSDLKSNDKVQMNIQTSFKNLKQPWYYERKRGAWKSLDRSEKKKYEKRKINMTDLGQTWLSYIGEPAKAIASKELIFSDQETYKEVYQTSQDVRVYLLSKKLFDKFNDYIGINNLEQINELSKNIDENMLSKLLRAKKLVVAHSVAMSKHILDERYKYIDGDKAERIIEYLDTDTEFTNNILKLTINSHGRFVEQNGKDIDILKLYKDKQTLDKLLYNVRDYLSFINIKLELKDI
ncbi:MAG: AIPR family protein [Clostridiales bacterium]|nr:AIPR family protein [Clostridiales bacterium]